MSRQRVRRVLNQALQARRELHLTPRERSQVENELVWEVSGLGPSWVELQVHFWVDTFSGGTLARGGTAAMAACRRVLLEHGFTVSSEVTTALALPPVEVRLQDPTGPGAPAHSGTET